MRCTPDELSYTEVSRPRRQEDDPLAALRQPEGALAYDAVRPGPTQLSEGVGQVSHGSPRRRAGA